MSDGSAPTTSRRPSLIGGGPAAGARRRSRPRNPIMAADSRRARGRGHCTARQQAASPAQGNSRADTRPSPVVTDIIPTSPTPAAGACAHCFCRASVSQWAADGSGGGRRGFAAIRRQNKTTPNAGHTKVSGERTRRGRSDGRTDAAAGWTGATRAAEECRADGRHWSTGTVTGRRAALRDRLPPLRCRRLAAPAGSTWPSGAFVRARGSAR